MIFWFIWREKEKTKRVLQGNELGRGTEAATIEGSYLSMDYSGDIELLGEHSAESTFSAVTKTQKKTS